MTFFMPGNRFAFAAIFLLILSPLASATQPTVLWQEAEGFDAIGGWVNDSQHIDIMGSPYLLATGLGKPVDNAVTKIDVPSGGKYNVWVRCRDWLPAHSPGTFRVLVDDVDAGTEFGVASGDDSWHWVKGKRPVKLSKGKSKLQLKDTTGWWGRCDAVVIAEEGFTPSNDPKELTAQRLKYGGVSPEMKEMPTVDVVVVGAGPAGLGAAVAAARNGAKVALIQDRPVVGGNSSDEIQVPPMGYIGNPPDRVNVTGLPEEFFPSQDWAAFASSAQMEAIVRAEKNITLYLNTRAYNVDMTDGKKRTPLDRGEKGLDGKIAAVLAIDVKSGQRMRFAAPRFIDCTGHGWIGYYAGAEYRMGQEGREEFNEVLAPLKPGKKTQGNTLYNATIVKRDKATPFKCPGWAYQWTKNEHFEAGGHRRIREIRRPENYDRPSRGTGRNPGLRDPDGGINRKWWVEFGGIMNTVTDAEKIRDELFRINLGLWNYAKNHNPHTKERNINRELVWLNYVPGVRESRRLVGPYIMTEHDCVDGILHSDTVAFTDWGMDVHHPEGFWVKGNDCIHVLHGKRTSIPYRSLYSRNVKNLWMAGRNHSATQMAHGATRVMRPCMGMGQAAGTAAAIATKENASPQEIYEKHITQLQQTLLKDGCYLMGVKSTDATDLARGAKVTASSSIDGVGPEKVIDGFSRVVGKDFHAWRAADDGPSWIELDLQGPKKISSLHLTFEDKPDVFRISAMVGDTWKDVCRVRPDKSTWVRKKLPADEKGVAEITSPLTRRQVVNFDVVEASRIRIYFSKPTSVCEIRLYEK